jgi:hypothetical protein
MGQARGLGDLGLAIGKTIPKGATLQQILAMIETRTKGAAKAAADANPWSVLQVKFKALEEELGTALLPAFTKLTNWIINDGLPGLKSIGKWISDNKGLFEFLVGTLAALWVAPKIDALLTTIATLTTAYDGLAVSAGGAATAESAATGGKFGLSKYVATASIAGAAGATIGTGAPMIGGATGLNKSATGRDIVRAGGTAAGAGAGALVGASMGSIIPVAGTAVGASVGALAGFIAGFLTSNPKIPKTGMTPASLQSQSIIPPDMSALIGQRLDLIKQPTKKTSGKKTSGYDRKAAKGAMGNTVVNFNGTVNDPNTVQKAVLNAVRNNAR